MSCETGCYEMQIECCETPIISNGLTPELALVAILTRPGSNKVYKRTIVVDAEGAIAIDKSTMPAGFFASGFINVILKKGADFAEEQLFTFDSVTYKCLLLEIVNTNDDNAE
ncbi:MAG: hypothetical protein JWO92_2536 [Chitinophagaceae bacterium]|nr:hypothetical protein [Chitinophagaceae bacterium]